MILWRVPAIAWTIIASDEPVTSMIASTCWVPNQSRVMAAARPARFSRAATTVERRAPRLGERLAAMEDPRGDLVRHAETDEEFAMTGRRHRAAGVVGIGPGADDRRVADPPRQLAGHPAGRGGGGEIAVTIARD